LSEQTDLNLIHATARELYGRAVWTHKVHEVEREECTKQTIRLNRWNIGIAALTTALAVSSPLISHPWGIILTALSAATNVCFVVAQASSNPAEKESQQRVAAKEVLCLREDLLLLIMRCQMSNAKAEDLLKDLESITRELTRAYKFMPNTSPVANGEAGKRLGRGEMTFSDEEIDNLLPAAMRTKIRRLIPHEGSDGGRLPKASGQS
jgi:hypothetical protein